MSEKASAIFSVFPGSFFVTHSFLSYFFFAQKGIEKEEEEEEVTKCGIEAFEYMRLKIRPKEITTTAKFHEMLARRTSFLSSGRRPNSWEIEALDEMRISLENQTFPEIKFVC